MIYMLLLSCPALTPGCRALRSPLVPLPQLPLFSSPRQPCDQLRYWHKLNKLSENSLWNYHSLMSSGL